MGLEQMIFVVASGFLNLFRVEAIGFSGGIWILWNSNSVGLEILAYSDQLIHAILSLSLPGSVDVLLTAVYGSPDAKDRKGLWTSLREACSLHSLPWLTLGDFNQVLSADEKLSRSGINLHNCQLMLYCLRHCNFLDLESAGPKFTWANNRDVNHYTRIKLDRALDNDLFLDIFKHVQVSNLPRTSSDHHPVCVKFSTITPTLITPSFRFENAWLSHDNFLDCVNTSWRHSPPILEEKLHT